MAEFVDCNGIRMAYRLDGPDDAPVVVFSNSLMCNFDMWQSQVDALATRFRVLRYDLRGQGRTEATPGPYAIDQFADDIYVLAKYLGILQVQFVGLSFGGLIGQQLALAYPDFVKSLTLCDTGSRFPPREIWNERIDIASSQGMSGLVEPTLARWFPNPPPGNSDAILGAVRRMIADTPADGFIDCCRTLRDTDLSDRLEDVDVPTLVIYGSEDPVADLTRDVHRKLPISRCIEIDGAGHLSNIDRDAAFNAALADHLEMHA